MINPAISFRYAGEAPSDFPRGAGYVLGAPIIPGIYVRIVGTTGFKIYWLKDLSPQSCEFLGVRDCLTHKGFGKVIERPHLPADR